MNPPISRHAKEPFPALQPDRLLRTVFDPSAGERVCILIDLEDPRDVEGFRLPEEPGSLDPAPRVRGILPALHDGVMAELGLTGGELFAYKITGGSNLDLPDEAVDDGRPRDESGEGCLPEVRHHPLHLDLLRHRAADGVREAIRLPRRDPARAERDHPAAPAWPWITTR